jgi:hypothetical protein
MATTKTKAANNGSFTCHFKLEKETKGAIRYMQVDEQGNPHGVDAGAQLGSVYIRKSAFKDGAAPAKITMVITEA